MQVPPVRCPFSHADGRTAGDHIRHDAKLALLTLLALFSARTGGCIVRGRRRHNVMVLHHS